MGKRGEGEGTDRPRCFRGCRTDIAPRELIYRDVEEGGGGEGSWKKEKHGLFRGAPFNSTGTTIIEDR